MAFLYTKSILKGDLDRKDNLCILLKRTPKVDHTITKETRIFCQNVSIANGSIPAKKTKSLYINKYAGPKLL